jgi:hypothetical protein
LLPRAIPSVIFIVILFVPTRKRHITFLFSFEMILSGKNKKAKSRAIAERQKDTPIKITQSYLYIMCIIGSLRTLFGLIIF